MGAREKEFLDIEILKETEPQMLAADPRLLQAAVLGFLIGLSAVLLALAIYYVLDDKIYVPGDLKSVTDLPFVGFSFVVYAETNREKKAAEQFQKDLEQNQSYLAEKHGVIATLEIVEDFQIVREEMEKLRGVDGVLLVIPYGRMDRTTCGYRIEQLKLQECRIVGIVIRNADMRFMKWYYNHL